MADHDDDLAPSKTAGFKVGEKKTVEEYRQLGKFWCSFHISFMLAKKFLSAEPNRARAIWLYTFPVGAGSLLLTSCDPAVSHS